MITENVGSPLKEERVQTIYDLGKGEVFLMSLFSVFIMKHFCKPL